MFNFIENINEILILLNSIFIIERSETKMISEAKLLGGVRDVALFHNPLYTNSIKPSMQLSCNFVAIKASEGSPFFGFLPLRKQPDCLEK
jgi:hypothetical protein